jgi:hypothetical protein
MQRKGNLAHHWWELKLVQSLMEDSIAGPQKSKDRITI